jgi:catechol 2,3-dioxygenase-like lactoylglutathione lyase family enzyme
VASRIDHLVLACADLAQGARFVRERLGVEVQPGGKHPLMGTHNALLALGPRRYLELIAIDREGQAQRPRWFGLDTAAVRERLARGPVLLTWVAACADIAAAAAVNPGCGEVIAASRGAFSWRITVPADGGLNMDGVAPTLIQWDGDAHPADGLADCGCRLREVRLTHPAAAQLEARLAALAVAGPIRIDAGSAALATTIDSPRGPVELG